jgi:uncharacterized protein
MTKEVGAGNRCDALRAYLRANRPLVIAYSGGVDSAFLLAVAAKSLGDGCLGVIADSPSLPRAALADALQLARAIGAEVEIIATNEMDDPNYTNNPVNRCYFCKAELFTRLEAVARRRGFRALAYGENADDAQQVRPGRLAAAEFRVLAPLRKVGLTKSEIRVLSRTIGLPTADAPAQPCLSSRIPHGTPVTPAALEMIERGEIIVRSFGFRVFRVRHWVEAHQTCARVEIAPNEMPALAAVTEALRLGLRGAGYDEVLIDPCGYRGLSR